jgi:hypothetical protein
MKACAILGLGLICVFSFTSAVFAHDGLWNQTISGWDSITLGHDDAADWKGWATLTVTNTMQEQWGDFHFGIFEPLTYNVTFPTSATMLMFDSNMNPYSGYTYTHDGTKNLDFFFYGNPVDPGETVTFKVYTDNTSNQHAWFGLAVWPTPVPEPVTILMLSLGGLLLRKRRA